MLSKVLDTHKGDSNQKTKSPGIRAGEPPANHSLRTMRNTVNSFRDRWDYFFQKKTNPKKPKLEVIEDELRSDEESEGGLKIEARKCRRGGLQVQVTRLEKVCR